MSDDRHNESVGDSALLAHLQLLRLSNLPTAKADVLMGFLVVHQSLRVDLLLPLVLLLVGGSMLYLAGMVLNDLFDFQRDCLERPERPLPSGKISLARARWLGFGLLLGGVAVSSLAGLQATALPYRGAVLAGLLAISILLYDGLLKKTPAAPLLMGTCRSLNVLLGMSFAVTGIEANGPLGFAAHQLWIAVGLGTFVTGITVYARGEAGRSLRPLLGTGVALMIGGILILGYVVPRSLGEGMVVRMNPQQAGMFMTVISFTFIYRCLWGIAEPVPARVQAAVKQCLLSIIILDGAVTAFFCDWGYALLVLALLLPTLVLGKWLYST